MGGGGPGHVGVSGDRLQQAAHKEAHRPAQPVSSRSLQKHEQDLGPNLTLPNSHISNVHTRSPDIPSLKMN